MSEQTRLNLEEFSTKVIQYLMENYWGKMWEVLENNPELKESYTTFLLNPEKLILYFGKTHWAIEYVGALNKRTINSHHQLEFEVKDYTKVENFLDEIIGIDYSSMGKFRMPLLEYNED
ncbi:hypothetical protein AB9M93_26225 [Peribacillus frigoritolerans]|uniref:hypothetical protein n=1 Tax=Peribacillus frigoritolerans TaxID=450367 RepID=UPI00351301E1